MKKYTNIQIETYKESNISHCQKNEKDIQLELFLSSTKNKGFSASPFPHFDLECQVKSYLFFFFKFSLPWYNQLPK